MSDAVFKRLSLKQIYDSTQIQSWLAQFIDTDRATAKHLLMNLRFVSRDTYSQWLKTELDQLSRNSKYAVFAVRKLVEHTGETQRHRGNNLHQNTYFDEDGNLLKRPAGSQGSEDLVNSAIANYVKHNKDILFDHPSIESMRREKIRHLLLVDDLIGSGSRIVEFINAMLQNKSLRSWWSFGWIKITVLSYARNVSAENYIYSNVLKKRHPNRKIPNREKIFFKSAYIYKSEWIKHNWGEFYDQIYKLCEKTRVVSRNYRLGYKNSFSNIVFLHSVPNNIPGVLHFQKKEKWNALMPNRTMPEWLESILLGDNTISRPEGNKAAFADLPPRLIELLTVIRSRVRTERILALRLNIDIQYTRILLEYAIDLGLLTEKRRLTKSALKLLHRNEMPPKVANYDYELYIPKSWCVR